MLSRRQVQEFKKTLNDRYIALRGEIRQELLQSDNQTYIDLAGEVHDLEEQSVADLLVDLGLAVIDIHIEEIRDIDAALLRIAHGDYGLCADCNDDIAVKRLQAHPTAKRCQPCQARYEATHASPATPSL